MKFTFIVILLYGCFSAQAQTKIEVTDYGVTPNSVSDATDDVRKAIESTRNQAHTYCITNTTIEEEYPSKKQRAGLFFRT